MEIAAEDLSPLLETAGFDEAASAARECRDAIQLSTASRGQLRTIYAVRREIQRDAGRPGVARQIAAFLDGLDAEDASEVLSCMLRDDDRAYVVWLNEDADRVIAVVVPPRRPSGELSDS